MKARDVVKTAYSMPLTSPAYPRGPYRFFDREFLVITYRTDRDRLREVVPEPLEIEDDPLVKFEFIRMPNSTGFGDYTEAGQVIPVRLGKVKGGYSHAMYLNDGPVQVATGTMGFKHFAMDEKKVLASLTAPNFLLKIIPHVDGSPRICEIVQYAMEDITLKEAWGGPAALDLRPHALAPVADLPVREIVSAVHLRADLTLGFGKIVHDYLGE